MKSTLPVLSMLLILVLPAGAQSSDDAVEAWFRFNTRIRKPKNFHHDIEVQYRNFLQLPVDLRNFHLYTLRWYLVKRWNNFFLQGSPVTFFIRKEGADTWLNEFRMMQMAGWYFHNDRFQIRAGLEERYFWNKDRHFEELRWRTRFLVSLPVNNSIRWQVSDELFLHERLSGSEVTLLDQNRIVTGLVINLSDKFVVDAGYQYQVRYFNIANKNGGDHYVFHVVYLYLNFMP
ncbi:MAG: DUF2490 domain-containing protein [Cyclobacteriaceae bacterium]|nr:DUF2490 domain-containing protein [Cyclobacteriaceae bacterium]